MDVVNIKKLNMNNASVQAFVHYHTQMNLEYDCVTEMVPSETQYQNAVSKQENGMYQLIWHTKEFMWGKRNDNTVTHVGVTFHNLTLMKAQILWTWLTKALSNNATLSALKWCWEHLDTVQDVSYPHRLIIAKTLASEDPHGRFRDWLQVENAHLQYTENNPYLPYFIPNANAKNLLTIHTALRLGQEKGHLFHIGDNMTSKVLSVYEWIIQKMQNRISFLVTVEPLKEVLTHILRSDKIYYVGPNWVSECLSNFPGVTFLSTKKTVEELVRTLPKYPLSFWDSLGDAFYKEYADNISLKHKEHMALIKNLPPDRLTWLIQKFAKHAFKNGNQLSKLHACLQFASLADLEITRIALKENHSSLPIDDYINAYKEHMIFDFDAPKSLHYMPSKEKTINAPEEEVLLFL